MSEDEVESQNESKVETHEGDDKKLTTVEVVNPNDDKSLKKTNEEELQNEPKVYVNFYICQLSLGIIFTYLYLFGSIMLNCINRKVFVGYKFNFNFIYMWLQQVFCLSFFMIASKTKKFKVIAGEISLQDFLKNKKHYIYCVIVYILNNLTSFYGTRLVSNMAMFLTFRKLNLVIVYILDLCVGKKKITILSSFCILMITAGSVISGVDKFTSDYLGITFVLLNNLFSLLYIKQTENFKKKTGLPNLKLLVYTSCLAFPLMLSFIFITGEQKGLINYFNGEKIFDGSYSDVISILIVSGCLVVLLNSSFFISNEKNSSLFTQILVNCKDIFVSAISYIWLKETNVSKSNVIGLAIAIIGAFIFSIKSFCDNFIAGGKKS